MTMVSAGIDSRIDPPDGVMTAPLASSAYRMPGVFTGFTGFAGVAAPAAAGTRASSSVIRTGGRLMP